MTSLRNEVRTLKGAVAQLTDEKTQLEQQLSTKSRATDHQLSDFDAQLQAANQKNAELERSADELRRKCVDVEARVRQAQDCSAERIAEFEAKLSDERQRNVSLQAVVDSFDGKVTELGHELKVKAEQYEENERKKSAYKEQLTAAQARLEHVTRDLESRQVGVSSLEQQLQRYSDKLETLSKTLAR